MFRVYSAWEFLDLSVLFTSAIKSQHSMRWYLNVKLSMGRAFIKSWSDKCNSIIIEYLRRIHLGDHHTKIVHRIGNWALPNLPSHEWQLNNNTDHINDYRNFKFRTHPYLPFHSLNSFSTILLSLSWHALDDIRITWKQQRYHSKDISDRLQAGSKWTMGSQSNIHRYKFTTGFMNTVPGSVMLSVHTL